MRKLSGFSELNLLENLATKFTEFGEVKVLAEVPHKSLSMPIYSFRLGTDDQKKPVVGLFAGVHGIERIGTHVVVNFLSTLVEQLSWDKHLQYLFDEIELVAIPLINPIGMLMGKRSNGNDVDLMRNAPVRSIGKTTPLVSGHRISPRLPWYQGARPNQMEIETQTVSQFVQQHIFGRPFALTMDIHSGFGMQDRLWYPYGKTKTPFPDIQIARKFNRLLNSSIPHHVYQVEPQSAAYTINGDLWDYLYDEHKRLHPENIFVPWTLELGRGIGYEKILVKCYHLLVFLTLFYRTDTVGKCVDIATY
ncbi:MAG: DUF2817 domain-containing protein [Bdellovibrionales bacterium]